MRWVAFAMFVLVSATIPVTASAQGWNRPGCRSASRPYPVILVHGRGGHIAGMSAIRDALVADGRCVFGINYGRERPDGPNGHARLNASGAEIEAYIDRIMYETGASKVDVVSHSAGTGVISNVILMRGSAHKVRRVVSFGGLHHPYAHIGIPQLVDYSLFLPNLIVTARRIIPWIDLQSVIRTAITVYGAVGGSLDGLLGEGAEIAASGMAADLFEPDYWRAIHGSLSEAEGVYLVERGTRGLHTRDSSPDVCYTNIVGTADLITGTAAGFQEEMPNVSNFVLPTLADHNTMLGDPIALAKMVADLHKGCVPRDGSTDPAPGTPIEPTEPEEPTGPIEPGPYDGGVPPSYDDASLPSLDGGVPMGPGDAGNPYENAFEDALREEAEMHHGTLSSGCGCSTAGVGGAGYAAWLLPLLGLVMWRRRR